MTGARRDLASPPALDVQTPPTDVPDQPPATDGTLAEPPADLKGQQRDIWRELAPYAVQQGTLIASTVAGFRELCEQLAFKRSVAAAITRRGAGRKDAESSHRIYARLAQRVDASLARFKLTSYGKPADAGFTAATEKRVPTPPKNPWATVAGGGGR